MKYSVVIPFYNSASFILNALNSLKNQTYKNIELILINDGSKDNSEEVVLSFKNDNPDMQIIYKKIKNSGPSTARNVGIDLATGDFISFLDSDDTYSENLFEEVEKVVSDEIDVVYWGFDIKNEKNVVNFKFLDTFKYLDNMTGVETAHHKYTKEIWLNNCNETYRLSMVKSHHIKYMEGIYAGEDANFIYLNLFNARKVRVIPQDLFHNNERSGSLFHIDFSEKHVTEFKAIENTLQYIKDNNIPNIYDDINSLYYHTRVTVAKRIVKSLKWYQSCKFRKLNKQYIPKMKKPKVLVFNKKQKVETNIYNFSKFVFFCFVKFYFAIHKGA